MRSVRLLPASLLVVAAACGDDGGNTPTDAAIDTPVDMNTNPAGCNFVERNDATNDIGVQTGMAEASGIAFAGTTSGVCGKFDNTHFEPGQQGQLGLVDIDGYTFTVGTASEVLVSLTGAGLSSLGEVQILIINADDQAIVNMLVQGDHALVSSGLPTGTYTLALVAGNLTAPAAAVDYKLTIKTDNTATRCVKGSTAVTTFAEVETTPNNLNDAVAVHFGPPPPPAREAVAGTTPEATNLTIQSGMTYRITGNSGITQSATDDYIDRDAFRIRTGANTDQLSVRINWNGNVADLDFLLFPANTIRDIAGGTLIGNSEDEFTTFAVKPNTDYWLWIAQFDTNAPTAMPYAATVCGESFAP